MTLGGRERKICVNGAWIPLGVENVADLLVARELDAERKGLAVAVNGEVIPRADWPAHALCAGDEIEIVGAVQGG